VKLVRRGGSESMHFLDAETGRELNDITTLKCDHADIVLEANKRDFRRVGWLLMPFDIEIKTNGQTVRKRAMETIEVNPDLEDSLYGLPKNEPLREMAEQAAIKKLDFVTGK
jgi:hypothetical protein